LSYKKLEVWRLARDVSIRVHRMTLDRLPKFEVYEENTLIPGPPNQSGQTLWRGCGRRRYKQDFITFLTHAHASCDETIDHPESCRKRVH